MLYTGTFLIYLMFPVGITFSLVAVCIEHRRIEKFQSFYLEQTLNFGHVCTGQYTKYTLQFFVVNRVKTFSFSTDRYGLEVRTG